nr:MAG TPA: hypothetical protein [Caudoviricetes sp.]
MLKRQQTYFLVIFAKKSPPKPQKIPANSPTKIRKIPKNIEK